MSKRSRQPTTFADTETTSDTTTMTKAASTQSLASSIATVSSNEDLPRLKRVRVGSSAPSIVSPKDDIRKEINAPATATVKRQTQSQQQPPQQQQQQQQQTSVTVSKAAAKVKDEVNSIIVHPNQETQPTATTTSKTYAPMPDHTKNDVSPDEFLQQLLKAMYGHGLQVQPALSLYEYFPEVSEEQIGAYDIKVVSACRENNLTDLKELYRQGQSMDCCNRFGESLLHMACRRAFTDILDFFLEEVGLDVRIRDDCGRTPLHDVCWNPTARLDLAAKVIQRDPSLLLVSDKRGHTPFQYARPEAWPVWRKFLWDNRQHLSQLDSEDAREVFGS